MRTTGKRRSRRSAVAGAVTVLIGLTAACSGGGGTSGDASGAGGAAASTVHEHADGSVTGRQPVVAGREPGTSGKTADSSVPGSVDRPVVQSRAVIRRGEVSLVTKEMNRARAQIDDLLGRHGGYLASEDTSNDRAGRPEESVLVLRVPEPSFDEVMTALTRIGKTEHADRSSEDVTTEVIDVNARVTTQAASIARLRHFLRQTQNVDDMIRLAAEIASREATLESLVAQQKYLSDETAMSTVTVRLRTPAAPPPAPRHDTGFLAGLRGGWAALEEVLVGAATVTGAALPFLVMFAVLGVPTWLVLRTAARRRRHPATEAAAPETP